MKNLTIFVSLFSYEKIFKKAILLYIAFVPFGATGQPLYLQNGSLIMQEIIIKSKTHGTKVVLVDDKDYDELIKTKWHLLKSKNTFYASRTYMVDGKKKHISMHRQILGLKDSDIFGEHKDHNGLNNQGNNIRKATPQQNSRNRTSRKNSLSKYLGVSFCSREKKYTAHIRLNNKTVFIAQFPNTKTGEVLAALSYNLMAQKHFDGFGNMNKIEQNELDSAYLFLNTNLENMQNKLIYLKTLNPKTKKAIVEVNLKLLNTNKKIKKITEQINSFFVLHPENKLLVKDIFK